MHKTLPESNGEPHVYTYYDRIDRKQILDSTVMQEIQKSADECAASLPSAYATERERIVSEMRKQSPSSYQGLDYADYPHWNASQVNTLAWDKVASNQVKRQMVERVNQRLQPIIQAKTIDWNATFQATARTQVENTIEQEVNRAVNQVRNTLGRAVFVVQRMELKNNQLVVV